MKKNVERHLQNMENKFYRQHQKNLDREKKQKTKAPGGKKDQQSNETELNGNDPR